MERPLVYALIFQVAWPGDRVQAAALLGGAPAYDAAAYDALLLKAALALLTPLGVDAAALS